MALDKRLVPGGGKKAPVKAPLRKVAPKLQQATKASSRKVAQEQPTPQERWDKASVGGLATGADHRVPMSQGQNNYRAANLKEQRDGINRNLGVAKPNPLKNVDFRTNDATRLLELQRNSPTKPLTTGMGTLGSSLKDVKGAEKPKAVEEKLVAANEVKNKRARKDTDETFDFSESLANFMNSNNPYAQAYLNAHGINPGNFNWYNDYGKMASEGDKDIWAAMITSSPKMKRAYIGDYGGEIDFNGDNDISVDEANQWYQNMKDANQVSDYDFTNTDDVVMQRIFGGLAGRGMNNDLIDALNMASTGALVDGLMRGMTVDQLIDSGALATPFASDTGNSLASTIGLLEKFQGEEIDVNDPDRQDKIARINNALKLDRLISAADRNRESGEKRNIIDFGDNSARYAQELSSLLSNVSGGSSNYMFSDRGVGAPITDANNKIYDTPTSGSPDADALELANKVVNSGGKEISNDLAYLLMSNLGAGSNGSLEDQGYKGYISSGKYDDPSARRAQEAQARLLRQQMRTDSTPETAVNNTVNTIGSQATAQAAATLPPGTSQDSEEFRQALAMALSNGDSMPSVQDQISQLANQESKNWNGTLTGAEYEEAKRFADKVGANLAQYQFLTGR